VLGLHFLDALIVLASLVTVIIIGIVVSRGVKSDSEFFVSGRSMGTLLQFFINFGQATDANGAPTIATEVYREGVAGMWIGFQTLFITPFIWFTSVWFRRARVITGPDLFLDRFGSRRLATFYAWFSMLQIPLLLGLGNIVSYKVASATMLKPESEYTQAERQRIADYNEYQSLHDLLLHNALPAEKHDRYQVLDSEQQKGELASFISYVSPVPFYIVYTGIVASYILLGGIKAAAITDAFQGILIIIFSVIMLPLGLAKVHGFHGLHLTLTADKFLLFGGSAGTDYAWYSILAIVFTGLVGFGAPTSTATSATAAAKDEWSLRVGMLSGLFCKRFVMIAWMLCGLLAAAIFMNKLADPDDAWGTLAQALLPPGLMGLMISGMLLGHMPAVGCNAVNFSAVFTRNLYEPLAPGKSEQHYLIVAKLATFGVLVLGALFALFFTGVISLLSTIITFNAYFGAAGILVYFWRKLTPQAVGIGAVVWIVLLAVLAWGCPQSTSFRRLPALLLKSDPYTTRVEAPATAEDVAAGRANNVGQLIPQNHVVPAKAMFFEGGVALSKASDPQSPLEGVGRFEVENFILYHLGLPLNKFGPAGLEACRWFFDGLFPFVVLIGLSYLTQGLLEREPANAPEAARQPLAHDPFSTQAFALGDSQHGQLSRRQQHELRIARFYAKMKTPIAPSVQQDQEEVAKSFADPTRFDHLKLFPGTAWEFTKWDTQDYFGFFGCWAGVLLVLGFLWFILQLGK
jgi:Na+/proline symporter